MIRVASTGEARTSKIFLSFKASLGSGYLSPKYADTGIVQREACSVYINDDRRFLPEVLCGMFCDR